VRTTIIGASLGILLSTLSVSAVHADAGVLTARELLLLCGSPKVDQRQRCAAYVAGVLDTTLYVAERLDRELLCPPEGTDGDKLHEVVLAYLDQATDKELERTAASMTFAALSLAFACQGL